MDLRSRRTLAQILQDAWGYFDTILGGDTFASTENSKLRGKLRLYRRGHERLLEATTMVPESTTRYRGSVHQRALDLPEYDRLDTERDMNKFARVGRSIAETIAKTYNLDPETGEAL